jgi:hypothetical protein
MKYVSRAWTGFSGAAAGFAGEVFANIRGVIILGLVCIGIASVLAGWGVSAPIGLGIGAGGAWALSW